MKVKELIERLHGLDGDMPVLFAFEDGDEGTIYFEEPNPSRIGVSAYVRHPWGEIDPVPSERAKGDEPLAVVLWP